MGEPVEPPASIAAPEVRAFALARSTRICFPYARSIGRADLIAFIDVINILEAENPSNSEFNERSGKNEVEEGEAFPLLGLRFEW